MIIRWHGTAAVEIESAGKRLLFDPYVPMKGSPVITQLEDYDGFDSILITHGHFDHIASLPAIAQRNSSLRIFCTATPYETLIHKGIPATCLLKIGSMDAFDLNGFHIVTFPGRHAVLPKATPRMILKILRRGHFSNLFPIAREARACPENGETLMYEVSAEGKQILIMGSMNMRDDVTYPVGCDALILPYNGWKDNFPPAVRIIERLKPKRILLDHYDDTFPPLTGSIDLLPLLKRYSGRIEPMTVNHCIEL